MTCRFYGVALSGRVRQGRRVVLTQRVLARDGGTLPVPRYVCVSRETECWVVCWVLLESSRSGDAPEGSLFHVEQVDGASCLVLGRHVAQRASAGMLETHLALVCATPTPRGIIAPLPFRLPLPVRKSCFWRESCANTGRPYVMHPVIMSASVTERHRRTPDARFT